MFDLPKTEAQATAMWDSIKPLYEQLKPKSDEEEELEKLLIDVKSKFSIGDRVHVTGTSYIGLVHSFNEKVGGFYPGIRYPIHVKIIECHENKEFKRSIGSVFEYGLDQVIHHTERYYQINAGHVALDNGAIAPIKKLFAIAELADQKVMTGHSYGDDYLHVPLNSNKRKALEDLLNEEKLIWKIVEQLPKHILELEI